MYVERKGESVCVKVERRMRQKIQGGGDWHSFELLSVVGTSCVKSSARKMPWSRNGSYMRGSEGNDEKHAAVTIGCKVFRVVRWMMFAKCW